MDKQTWQNMLLTMLKEALDSIAAETMLLPQTGGDILRSAYAIPDDKIIVADLFFSKFDYDQPIFQLYFHIGESISSGRSMDELLSLLQDINLDIPVGCFGFSDENRQLFYKNSMMFRSDDDLNATTEAIIHCIGLMLHLAKIYYAAIYDSFET